MKTRRSPQGQSPTQTLLAAKLTDSTDWDTRAYAHSVAEAELDLQRVQHEPRRAAGDVWQNEPTARSAPGRSTAGGPA